MKILHICAADHGGAGIAAMRIHSNLRRVGLDSRMLVLDKRSQDPWTESPVGPRHPFRLRRFFHKALLKVSSDSEYYFQMQGISPAISTESLLKQIGFVPDVIVAHVLSHFLSSGDLLKLHKATGAPVIWHLMDMAGFTGGCHYAWSCRRYEARCGECPALRLRSDKDASRRIWNEKAEAVATMNMAVVAGSAMLCEQAERSSLFQGRRIETILLGVDHESFRQRDRREAKRVLGLPDHKRVIFFGAQKLKARRKGMRHMLNALERLASILGPDRNGIQIVTAGNVSELGVLERMGLPWRHLGFLRGDAQLALAYQAADVFVCPSIEDSGPMMINESMMCGTPVVAFEMGVASDLIIQGMTGYIAKLKDAGDLATGIAYVLGLNEKESIEMSDRCRERALALCHPQRQAERFVNLIVALCGRDASYVGNSEQSRFAMSGVNVKE